MAAMATMEPWHYFSHVCGLSGHLAPGCERRGAAHCPSIQSGFPFLYRGTTPSASITWSLVPCRLWSCPVASWIRSAQASWLVWCQLISTSWMRWDNVSVTRWHPPVTSDRPIYRPKCAFFTCIASAVFFLPWFTDSSMNVPFLNWDL